MKKLILALVIFLCILTAGIFESIYVREVFYDLNNSLNEIEKLVLNEDSLSLEKTNALQSWWNNKRENLDLFSFSQDSKTFTAALYELQGFLQVIDYRSAYSKLQSLFAISNSMNGVLGFTAKSII